ncbi:MAG TPA: tRNA pseudouridine(38-40) synthase TruA [Streptosporangiaceae bacterium]|nr:tRNA pseudouridine(38-40) synthase TruA [Streptosporangiaceae bacterium]
MTSTPDPPAAAAVRVRLDLSYDGAGFSGWARQPHVRTVQAVLEEATARLLRRPEPPRLTVAGRTDAGVHARGQVAHADVPAEAWARAEDHALRRLAALLPPDVRVHAIRVVPAAFDARFSALWRRYSYRVSDDPVGVDPLRRHDTVAHRRPLDVEAMNAAARALLGEHDFAAFCRRRAGATSIRRLIRLEWVREGDAVAVATVLATAFCHNMVRALVGAMFAVGDGRRPIGWPRDVLERGVRDPAVHVAPPHGLCLEEVRYPPDGALAESRGVTAAPARARDPGGAP